MYKKEAISLFFVFVLKYSDEKAFQTAQIYNLLLLNLA